MLTGFYTMKIRNLSCPGFEPHTFGLVYLGAVTLRFRTVLRRTIHVLRHCYWLLNRLTAATTNGNDCIVPVCSYVLTTVFLRTDHCVLTTRSLRVLSQPWRHSVGLIPVIADCSIHARLIWQTSPPSPLPPPHPPPPPPPPRNDADCERSQVDGTAHLFDINQRVIRGAWLAAADCALWVECLVAGWRCQSPSASWLLWNAAGRTRFAMRAS